MDLALWRKDQCSLEGSLQSGLSTGHRATHFSAHTDRNSCGVFWKCQKEVTMRDRRKGVSWERGH